MKNGLRRGLWLVGSLVVLALIIFHLRRSPEWRSFDWAALSSTLFHARPGLLLLALVAMFSTYLVRAYRWRFFLDPIKKASLWVLFTGQILGFSSIYLIGRAGEFVRPAYIARKENVPFSSMAAVWLLERIFDGAFLTLLFAASLSLTPIDPATRLGSSLLGALREGGRGMLALTALMVAGLVVFRLHAEPVTVRLAKVFRFLPGKGPDHLERFLRSFARGLEVIQNWKDFLACVATTVLLWVINVTAFWLLFESLGGGLERLTWMAAVIVLFCAALGLVVQFPGIGGGYQVGAILALTQVFRVRAEMATSAGIMAWLLMSVPCLAVGLALLVYEGLTFKHLREIAERERAAMVEKV